MKPGEISEEAETVMLSVGGARSGLDLYLQSAETFWKGQSRVQSQSVTAIQCISAVAERNPIQDRTESLLT